MVSFIGHTVRIVASNVLAVGFGKDIGFLECVLLSTAPESSGAAAVKCYHYR